MVHALPVLNALREALPDAYLAWACHAGVFNLLEGHPQLDEVIVVPRRNIREGWRDGLSGGFGAGRWTRRIKRRRGDGDGPLTFRA